MSRVYGVVSFRRGTHCWRVVLYALIPPPEKLLLECRQEKRVPRVLLVCRFCSQEAGLLLTGSALGAHPLTGEALSQLEARPAMPGLDELLRNRRPAAGPPRMMRSNIMSILNNTDKESLHTHTILKGIAGYTGPDSHMGERAAMDHSQRKAKFWIFERKNGIQLHVNRGSFKMKKSDLVQSRRSRRCRLTLGWNASVSCTSGTWPKEALHKSCIICTKVADNRPSICPVPSACARLAADSLTSNASPTRSMSRKPIARSFCSTHAWKLRSRSFLVLKGWCSSDTLGKLKRRRRRRRGRERERKGHCWVVRERWQWAEWGNGRVEEGEDGDEDEMTNDRDLCGTSALDEQPGSSPIASMQGNMIEELIS